MKILFILLTIVSLLQGGYQPVNIPIKTTSFDLGYGASLSQDLIITPLQVKEQRPGYDGVYILTFDVANYFPNYPGEYDVEIDFGTQKLCEAYGWGTRPTSQVTVTCPISGYLIVDKSLPGGGEVQGAKPLVLTVTVNDGSYDGGWQLLFKNVSLNFVAEE